MTAIVFDAGALIAYEREQPLVRELVGLAARGDVAISTSSAVVAQAWRGGARQARLARLLRSELVEEVALEQLAGRRIGAQAAATGATDVVDGHVAMIATDREATVVTSDPDDLVRWGVSRDSIVRC